MLKLDILQHYTTELVPLTTHLQHKVQTAVHYQNSLVRRVIDYDDTTVSLKQLAMAQRHKDRAVKRLRQHLATLTWIEDNLA